ncbi:MAG: hypothetical protein ACTSVY_16015 [Candidatus Helarchaeota archaeon]
MLSVNPELLELINDITLLHPEYSINDIIDQILREIINSLIESIIKYQFPELKSRYQRKKDELQFPRWPKKRKEAYKKNIKYENKIRVFRMIQNSFQKNRDFSNTFEMEKTFEGDGSQVSPRISWVRDLMYFDFNPIIDKISELNELTSLLSFKIPIETEFWNVERLKIEDDFSMFYFNERNLIHQGQISEIFQDLNKDSEHSLDNSLYFIEDDQIFLSNNEARNLEKKLKNLEIDKETEEFFKDTKKFYEKLKDKDYIISLDDLDN